MNWPLATAIAVLASVCGDLVGYGVGRFAGKNFVDRYGRYLGYAGAHKVRIETLFARWGGVTVFLTRTLVSHMSSVASVLAGLSRYAFSGFLVFAVAGRVVWTAAYFGAGYWVGTDLESSASFLGSVTGLVVSLGVVAISAYYLLRGWRRPAAATLD
jgi:membrane protein DedA with SNARE-associated domain